MKFTDKNRDVYLNLPVKVTCDGKEFWIKKSTKTSGIYMNDVPPKIEIVVKEDENTSISNENH